MTENTASTTAPRKGFLNSTLGRATIVVGLIGAIGAGAAYARGGFGPGHGGGFGPGGFGRGGLERICSADLGYVTQRMADRLTERLKLTDAQKPALAELRTAAIAAGTEAKKSCGQKPDLATMPGRLAANQQRMAVASTALATIKPKLDAFYATLTDEQKKDFDRVGHRGGPRGEGRMGWRGGPEGGPGQPPHGGQRPPAPQQ